MVKKAYFKAKHRSPVGLESIRNLVTRAEASYMEPTFGNISSILS